MVYSSLKAIVLLFEGSYKNNKQLEGKICEIAPGRHKHLFAGFHRNGEPAAIIYVHTDKLLKYPS